MGTIQASSAFWIQHGLSSYSGLTFRNGDFVVRLHFSRKCRALTLGFNSGALHIQREFCTSKNNLVLLASSSPPPSLFSAFILSFCFFFFSSHHFCQNLCSKHSEWCAQLGGLACASCPISPGSCSHLCPAPTQVPSSALGWFSAKNPLMENTGKQCRLYWRVLWGQSGVFSSDIPQKITLKSSIGHFHSLKSLSGSVVPRHEFCFSFPTESTGSFLLVSLCIKINSSSIRQSTPILPQQLAAVCVPSWCTCLGGHLLASLLLQHPARGTKQHLHGCFRTLGRW